VDAAASAALVVLDMTLGFTDPESPLACELEGPISEIQKLLRAARRAEIPIVFTTVAYRESDKLTAAAFIDKVPALITLRAGTRWAEIDPRIAPEEKEPVLNKLFASGFFGTGLSSLLTAAGIHPHHHRRVHLWMRPRNCRRRPPVRVPSRCPQLSRRRPQP
jgi:maleamate amidohydrolase